MLSVGTNESRVKKDQPSFSDRISSGAHLTGREFILLIEDAYNWHTADIVQKNPFWVSILNEPEEVPEAVYHGLCIENYQLLFRESYFDSPILPYSGNRRVRELVNEFYVEELGHDKLLLKSLNYIGLSEADLFESIPLPGTMALCNALSYWARVDPLFFFTTLGVLEGREVEVDSFVVAMHRKELAKEFVGPIETHANINKNAGHGALAREIFEEIPGISGIDAQRMLLQAKQFILIYDRFYRGIWEHYRTAGTLLRQVSQFS